MLADLGGVVVSRKEFRRASVGASFHNPMKVPKRPATRYLQTSREVGSLSRSSPRVIGTMGPGAFFGSFAPQRERQRASAGNGDPAHRNPGPGRRQVTCMPFWMAV